MHYALVFKDAAGFWCLGPVFDDKNIPANMMKVALDSGQIHRTDIAVIARPDVEALEAEVARLNTMA